MKEGELLEGQAISDEAKREAKATLEKAGMGVRATGKAAQRSRDTAPFDGHAPASQWTAAKKIDSSPPPAPVVDPLEKAAESIREVPRQLPVPITHLADSKESLVRAGFAVSTNPGVEPQATPRVLESERATNPSMRRVERRRSRIGWVVALGAVLAIAVVFWLVQGSQPANGDQGEVPRERASASAIATATATAVVVTPPTTTQTATSIVASELPPSTVRTAPSERSSEPRPPKSARPSAEIATATATTSPPVVQPTVSAKLPPSAKTSSDRLPD